MRKSYLGAESRFCRFLAENYRLQNIKNVEARYLRAYVEHLQSEGDPRPTSTQHYPVSAFITGTAEARTGSPKTKTCIWKSVIPEG